ncbi:hypothetical protein U1Q18_024337 [Sarracenia purpurea var. burkii]
MPQRQSPRGPVQLRTSSSDSDTLHHHRPITDRSPKLGERRSPRDSQSDPLNQKKFGTRIADLESQLGQAQEELKFLKEQLASAEAAKKDAQEQLEKKSRKSSAPVPGLVEEVEKSNKKDKSTPHEIPDDNCHCETDVFEVPMEKVTVEPMIEFSQPIGQEDHETKPISTSTELPQIPTYDELALKNDEINLLKAKLEEKVKELEVILQECQILKTQLNEAALEISTGRAKEEEMSSRLSQLGQQMEESGANEAELKEKLEAVEREKEALEAEMKKLRVQTEQWRKAADAAATVLAGGVDMNGRRISDRCGSIDKHIGSMFEPSVGGYPGFVVGSPGLGDDSDDGFGGGKRKGSGIRMFGDLWKKKGHK